MTSMVSDKKGILCPECGKLISSDEKLCPYCGHVNPGSRWKRGLRQRGDDDGERLMRLVVYINIGMYVLSLLLTTRRIGMSWNPFFALSPDVPSLYLLGATGAEPIGLHHRWWTLVAANYLHGSILHIFFNMMAFRQLAPFVIREYGLWRMVLIYGLGGAIGFWVSYVAGVRITIGASAAVCALIGAALYYGKSRGGTYGHAVYRQVSGWVLGLFVFGLIVPGINNWGHGGGILGGILLGYLLGYAEKQRERFGHRAAGMAVAGMTVLVLAYAVVTGIVHRMVG